MAIFSIVVGFTIYRGSSYRDCISHATDMRTYGDHCGEADIASDPREAHHQGADCLAEIVRACGEE